MLQLLKRDLKLHRLLLTLPIAILFLGAYFAARNAQDAMAFTCLLALLVGLVLPLSFHLRERSEGTLGQLVALPITRAQVVQLRYGEALLLPAVALGLLALEGLVFPWLRPAPAPPLAHWLRGFFRDPLFLAWCFFWCFAYPLPAVLRWGARGLGLAAAIPFLLMICLGVLFSRSATATPIMRFWRAHCTAPWEWIATHQPALLALLLVLFVVLSLKAIAAEDL